MLNPLFNPPDETQEPRQNDGYILRNRHAGKIEPLSKDLAAHASRTIHQLTHDNPAVELIRRKVAAIYAEEPSAKAEMAMPEPPRPQRSPHQEFMHQLSTSGKPLAVIQTEWHNYYTHLPDAEKHAVWREFYAANAQQQSAYTHQVTQAERYEPVPPSGLPRSTHRAVVSEHTAPAAPAKPHRAAKGAIKKRILQHVAASSKAQAKAKQHFQSLLFGVATGSVVLVIFLFGFFNEMIIAPFIQPSRHVSATPIIVDSDSVAAGSTPEIIIPKLNVQIPVVYDQASIKEADVQKSLEKGVIHYPTTVLPGQRGNAAFFGHSSNNIFNKGKYKFAFALLRQLVPGDIFYLTYDKKVYSYRVFDKKVVAPSEVAVLGNVDGKPVTASLITCDPPGTSTNRLVVWGEQISPDPTGATAPITPPVPQDNTPTELPSEGPTLWNRFWNAIF